MELEQNQNNSLMTQADAFLYFLQRLDLSMVDAILEENRTYQDFEKHVFIRKLGYSLHEFIQAGDTFLNRYHGCCNSKTCTINARDLPSQEIYRVLFRLNCRHKR